MTDSTQSDGRRTCRVAIVGAGKMGINHIRALSGCTGVQLVAVADPQADRAQLEEHIPPGVEVLQDVEDLLVRVRPDAVHIVTPPLTHTSLARAALLSGAHVYVEKPFTATRAEAELLTTLAAERGLRICAGHQCLFDDASRKGLQRLGEIGDVVQVESYFSFRTVRKSITPIDQAMDILPHAVYMLLGFLRAGRSDAPLAMDGLRADADGSVNAIFTAGLRHGFLSVSLRARPVEQYLHVAGSNGSLRVDLVTGAVMVLPGAGANIGAALVNPYRYARQTVAGATAGFVRHLGERKFGYPGLRTLFQGFYDSLAPGAPPVMSDAAIVETVAVCEHIGQHLQAAAESQEHAARAVLAQQGDALAAESPGRCKVLVTGAGGFLGQRAVRVLRERGWAVRAVTRRPPRWVDRVAGVEYRECDLATGVPASLLEDVSTVVHCAAETSGGKAAQERNSIRATRLLLEATADAGVRRFIHVSSLGVLASRRGTLDEATPVDASLERGPYVWGKAESENLVRELGRIRGVDVRVVRPGPLVDFVAFDPPGRLGREVGPWFVAIGPARSRLPLIDVNRAASALAAAVEQFDEVPEVVNLVEPHAPTRAELVERLRKRRPDLRAVWVPLRFLKLVNPLLKIAQRVVLGTTRPLDVAAAFDAVRYDTRRSADLIAKSERAPAYGSSGAEVRTSAPA